jgi:hypothetical protein
MVVYILSQVILSCGCFDFDIERYRVSFIFLLIIDEMNLKRPLFKFCILTKPDQCRIYGVHDEAKDKAFELELSWICDESKRQHQKVLWDIRMKNDL